MSEDMYPRAQRMNTEEKVLAPERHIYIGRLPDLALCPGENSIEYPERRGMRDQHIRVTRDELPFLLQLATARKIESPVVEGWLPRRPPELHAAVLRAGILKVVDRVRHEQCDELRISLEQVIVTAGYDNFFPVWLRSDPFKPMCDLSLGSHGGSIASMNEHIPCWDWEGLMKVCVGDADDQHRLLLLLGREVPLLVQGQHQGIAGLPAKSRQNLMGDRQPTARANA